ncbi:uncharacterized protein LOC134229259 [Saccostrea cucullata]|uniref:uncharacterized protein LOC134229259 n=1 Tax=Saccostrea cuccullata TaxID=36930 RepID=UPI002ED4528D
MLYFGFCLTVLLSFHASPVSSALCDDADYDACTRLSRVSDVCNDLCFAKYCPRTCGKCPLKCYNCSAEPSANTCNTTEICSSFGQKCIVMESLNSDLSMSYKSGCATGHVCSLLFGGQPHQTRGQCCDHDLCNHVIPHSKRITGITGLQGTDITLNTNLELFRGPS